MVSTGQINISIKDGKTTSSVATPSHEDWNNILKHQKATLHVTENAAKKEYLCQFKDFANQIHKVTLKDRPGGTGIMYHGTQRHKIPASYYQSIGASPNMAKVLAFVSSNEGNFDAINSWDNAVFSFGFMQFAGPYSLHTLLALIKYRAPHLFYDCFQRFGIDVEYRFRNNKFEGQQFVVMDPNTKKVYKDKDALQQFRDNKLLTCAFLRAGYDIEIAKLQVLLAVAEYANPALDRSLTITTASGSKVTAPTASFIKSPAGITALIDLAVNQGGGGVAKLFTNAISAIAKRDGLNTEAQLQNIDEGAVLRQIVKANPSDKRIVKRVGKALDNMSTAK